MIPEGITRSRTSRFNVARLPTTETRPSRGPWLAIGLCCPDGSSLTTASCEPLNPSPLLMVLRRGLLHQRKKGLKVGIQRVPNLLRWTVLACRLPYPGDPKSAIDCFFLFGISLHPGVTGSATTLEVSRLQSSLIPKSTGIVTARKLASPPFEDVYIRACADEVALNQRRI